MRQVNPVLTLRPLWSPRRLDLAEMLRETVASYRSFLLRCRNEREVAVVLAAALGCRREVPTPAGTADLVRGDTAVEVEFEKRPYRGMCQAAFYKAVGGFPRGFRASGKLIYPTPSCLSPLLTREEEPGS